MKTNKIILSTTLAACLCTFPGLAQQTDQQAPPPPPDQPYPQSGQPAPPAQGGSGWHRFGESRSDYPPPADTQDPDQNPPEFQRRSTLAPMPAQLNLASGTWLTVRMNQRLSSDHNQPGDAFTGTLVQPLVAQGRVIAQRGQTVAGRVTDVEKHHTAAGRSRLALEITEVQLMDGQQIPIRTQLIERQNGTHAGSNAAVIGTTMGAGAAIGAAVNGGVGAGVGAAAGLVVSTIGVLAGGGHAAVVYPEMVLTFRLEAPVTIDSTSDAFVPVNQGGDDPGRQRQLAPRYGTGGQYGSGYGYGASQPRPYYGGYPYSYGYPYAYGYPYWGPSFYFYSGPRFYGGFRGGFRGGYRGGFRR